jgi:DNA polymerase-3 subunit beta
MRFITDRDTLLSPLMQIISVVERRQTLPVLSNFLIRTEGQTLLITATDLEVELVAKVPVDVRQEGEVTVPARKLVDICRNLPDSASIELKQDQDRVHVISGRSRFRLSTLPAEDFPLVEDIGDVATLTVPESLLKNLIERTHFAMAVQDVRYFLNGLLIEIQAGEIRAVATDGHRLAMCTARGDVDVEHKRQVILPRKGVQELLKLLEGGSQECTLEVGINHVRVSFPDVRYTTKLIDGRFPDYDRVLPSRDGQIMVANREQLRQAFARTAVLSNEKYRGIRLNIEPGSLKILAHNPEQEQAEDEMEVNYDGHAIEIGFNVNYLLDALGAIEEEEVQFLFHDGQSSTMIEPAGEGDCRYVVMPMRL